jgi:hypothetical protein
VVAEGVADLLIAAEAGNAPTASMAPAAIAGMTSFRVSFTARPLLVLFVSSLILLITAGERPGGNSQLPKRKSLESMSTDAVRASASFHPQLSPAGGELRQEAQELLMPAMCVSGGRPHAAGRAR